MRRLVAAAFAIILCSPALARAQASITGVVRDSSGGVLPGAMVEVSSDALIEKLRTATSDSTGQYRIVDLRPGIYTVTISLVGFSTFRREGIELTGSFTASISADLKVGEIQETVTVSAESPIVDVQSVRRQTTVTSDLITSIPTARSYAAMMFLIPAVTIQSGNTMDVQVTPQMTVFGGAGGRSNEGRMQVDGLNTGAALNGGGVSTYIVDVGNAEEVTTTSSGGLGEAEVGGPTISVVPKTGGNTIKGQLYLSGVPTGWVGNNYTDALRTAGLTTPGKLIKQWDFNGGIGGPIRRDRLWFFATARDEGQYRTIPGIYPNLNAGDATQWLYAPDTSREVRGAESWTVGTIRVTLQASPRNKFNFYWDEQHPCNGAAYSNDVKGCRTQPANGAALGAIGLGGLTATTSPETSGYLSPYGQRAQQVTWTSPVTSRLLLEAGMGTYLSAWGPFETPGNPTRDLVRVTEQCSAGCAANGNIPNLTYRSMNWLHAWNGTFTWRASASYVTGAQSMKFGLQGGFLVDDRQNFTNSQNLTFRLNNGIPNRITETALPFQTHSNVRYDAFYAQDVWTRGRITLQGALRFDYARSYFPEQTIGPSNYLPFSTSFPETDGVAGYKDFTPRAGLAYDVFGTGKTSLKVNVGKYLEPASNGNGNYSIANPTSRIATTANRAWTDGNSNFKPDCDLVNPLAQDNRATGGDLCAQIDNLNFGKPVFSNTIDPAILGGWGIRPSDWQVGISVQQQLRARVSIEIGYNRRWLQNFTVTDNLEVALSDFTAFSITAPRDPRLPNGGGYTVSGLFDVNPLLFGQTRNFITNAKNFGEAYQRSHGILLNVVARPRNGLTFQGGFNTGKTVQDICGARSQLPEFTIVAADAAGRPAVGPTNPWCHSEPGFITRVTGFGAYMIPKIEVQISGTVRSDQGGVLTANWAASNAFVQPALGRPIAGGLPNLTINLVQPGQVWGDRVNEVDVRVAKVLRLGHVRNRIGVDIFNVLNSAAILTYNQAFVPNGAWLVPNSVLTPRFVKFAAQIEF